jgi:photosystem I subunit 12
MMASCAAMQEEWKGFSPKIMASSLTQAEVLIALVVAAHAGVLAVRLCVSLYRA